MKKLTTEEFIEKAKLVHGDKYDYSESNYINTRTKININCQTHGGFEQRPNSHLKGNGCIKCGLGMLSQLDFINRAKLVHGDKYDYSNLNFTGTNNKVKIICSEHGEFEQLCNTHLKGNGCSKCSFNRIHKSKILNIEDFIIKAKNKHGNKYDYSLVKYINNITKVKIICPEHGEFEQTPQHHKRGNGCKKCGDIKTGKAAINTSRGWSLKDWENKLNKVPGSKPIIYVIKCFNKNETFIKIGITMRSVKKRFSNKTLMPYSFEILLEKTAEPDVIFNAEILIKKEMKEKKYLPLIKFSGYNECFNKSSEKTLIDLIIKKIK